MKRSDEFRELLASVPKDKLWCREYIDGMYMLMCAYEVEEDERCVDTAREIIRNIDVSGENATIIRNCYDTLARHGDFEAFMIAMEWNRPLEKQFYLPRANVLKQAGVISAFQDLQDDKLDLLVLNMPPRVGKNQSDDTPVLTKNGWKKHGDLKVGDEVLNDKGEFVRVLATSDKYPCEYEVTFSDGSVSECHGNHDWVVYDRATRKETIRSTKSMVGKLRPGSGTHSHYRFQLPLKEPVKGIHKELLVDPYTLGVWLGDGTNKVGSITIDKNDKIIADTIINNGYNNVLLYVHPSYGTYRYTFKSLYKGLQKYNMCFSRHRCVKHIPEEYLTASIEQRLELLAGLLDTDGTLIKKEHRYHFSTTEEQLKDDFVSLVSTFGWRCSVTKNNACTSSSGIIGRKDVYDIGFNPTMFIPCRLERKQLYEYSKQRRVSVVDIQPIKKPKKGKCIQVEGGVYLVGKQLTPTHNSTLSLFFIVMRAALYPDQSILGNGHSTALVQAFYKEFMEMVTSDEYRFNEIFPDIEIVDKSAEYNYLDFNRPKRFHTITFKSIEGGTTGLAEASNLLYCDDLVKDAEQANNKDRLDKLYEAYTSTIKDRKVSRLCKDGVYRSAPELHVNTPWSIYDVTSRVVQNANITSGEDRVRVVSVPCWNENHESNFMYGYGKGFDVKYYEEMELAEDPVIFSAKYLCKPIEREGRPFEKDNLTYFTELPLNDDGSVKIPDTIVAYNDVAHGGKDYMSMPIAYVYGADVYIADVLYIHNFSGDTYSRPLVCEMLMRNKVVNSGYEKNNGGDFYASMINEDLHKIGYRCNVTSYSAPTNKSKLDRILSCQSEIQGLNTMDGSYRLLFRHPKTISQKGMYMEFLRGLWNWSQATGNVQKTQSDDAPDSLAGLLINMLGKRAHGSVGIYDIRKAGY